MKEKSFNFKPCMWSGSTILFPRVDYSSYCTPANMGGLPAWLGLPGTCS